MFTRFCAVVAKYCLMLAIAGLVAIIACVSLQVFGRYVLNDTPTWAEALALVLVIWVTMFGAAVGVRDAGHIGMESLLVLVSEPVRNKLEIVIHVLSGVFGALMAWYGAVLAESVMGYKIPTLGIPEGLNQVPVSIAGALIVLFSIEHIIALVKGEEVVPSWH
ncbi:MAG TPA: TRAP transporter small permease [Casimicrobiaceae bacterium]|nr:TRAP transporter small permease [Casimicrobiaceae bacterium]